MTQALKTQAGWLTTCVGELCGSVFVDQCFEQYIRRRLGDTKINNMRPRAKNEMMSSWERNVKFKFGNETGPEGFEVNVPGFPDSRELNVEDNFHSMETYVVMCFSSCTQYMSSELVIVISSSKDVQAIFDPVVDYIVKLVDEQYWAVEKRGKSVAVGSISMEDTIHVLTGFRLSCWLEGLALRCTYVNGSKSRLMGNGVRTFQFSNP